MSTLLDTSVVVRYLVADPPEQASRAAALLDGDAECAVTGLVLVEAAYVLTSVYGVARDVVVDHLIALLQKENVHPLDIAKPLLVEALLSCRPSGRVSFSDAVIWAGVRQYRIPRIATFDRRFPSDGVELVS